METIAFARGVPAPEMLPVDALRAAAARALEHDPHAILSYGTGAGWPPLRELLAQRHTTEIERVVVTTGSLHGFWMLVQVLARRAGEHGRRLRVIVEEPTYDRPLLLLRRLGAEIVSVPLDADGLDVDAFERAAEAGADLAYLIPTFQNPSGATLSADRREAVLDIAARHDVPILEDDPYGLLHFDAPPPLPLFSSPRGASVSFSGSLSKSVAPGLRVGWLVVPRELAEEVARFANDTYISASFLGQATAHEYLVSEEFERNLVRCRQLLATRCDTLCEALDRHLADATWSKPAGGYFTWVRLPEGLDGTTVAAASATHGATVVAGASFGAGCADFVRLAHSSPPLDSIDLGVRRLASACDQVAVPSGARG